MCCGWCDLATDRTNNSIVLLMAYKYLPPSPRWHFFFLLLHHTLFTPKACLATAHFKAIFKYPKFEEKLFRYPISFIMAPQPVTKLSSLKLGLPHSQRIRILHQADQTSEPIVLFANFLKDLAVALCPYIARALDAVPLNQVPLSELRPNGNAVTIKVGHAAVHTEVLRWILNYGEAGKTVNCRSFGLTFHSIAMMALSCEQLQVAYLPAQLINTMSKICDRYVHSVEVEKVFTSIKGPHRVKTKAYESIATAM